MRQLLEALLADKEVRELTEMNWKSTAVAGLTAASLALGNPSSAFAGTNKSMVTQAEHSIDLNKLLHAIKQVESSGGRDTRTRYEPGFENLLRKRYHTYAGGLRDAINKYGFKAVATSYGPYQVMAATAYELGFSGQPDELSEEQVSRLYAEKYLRKLMNSNKTKNVQDIISAYNAGLGGIGSNPEYLSKVLNYYNR